MPGCGALHALGLALAAVVLLTRSRVARAYPFEQFYPHGGNLDAALPTDRWGVSSPEIPLTVPVRFYGENFTSIFVNANGLVSFLTDIPTFYNLEFPLDYPIIAPLYTNVDLRGSGQVLYRETNARSFFPNTARDYQATSAFITTWLRVGYYDSGRDKVTFFNSFLTIPVPIRMPNKL
nr:PREDICTED: sushi, nidogen and EGF-like domain-containing protein 1 [Bemisia tabaci]